ncbi:MAG TPA: MFS transporter [Kouleothrix sp.]|uniref:MFS transporter n=1 Tax=Kouleothrix sp. TaxID=2779161 RepID=UPI002B959E0A|nr:MFS transporter [Kouleothrix sp.]HRC77089.1 MFS transporter [Kouleothrix sp.]
MTQAETQTRNRLLGLLFIGVLMAALDIAIVGPALPAIRAAFGVDDRAAAWIFTIYVLFNLIGTPLMAKLSDLFGRRAIYVLDVALFAFGSLLVAISPGFGVLLAGRAIQGLGAGGIFPVASAVIGDTFPPEKRGSALGLIGAVFGIAFLIGPIIGGVLLIFGWPWLFIINLPLAALVIGLGLRLLPSSRPATQPSFDWLGMAVLGALLTALAYGLNQLDTANIGQSLASLRVWPFLAAAIVLVPVLWLLERRAADPILRTSLFGRRQISLTAALAAGAGLAEAAVVFVPALVVAAFGVSESQASFMLVPVVLAMAVGSPLSGRMLDRSGSRVVVLLGSALVTLGMLLLSFFATSLALFYVSAVLFGLGLSVLLGAALRYIMLNEAPASERASAQAILTIFTSVGQLLGGTLAGAVAASRGGGVLGYTSSFFLIGVVMLLLTLAALGLKGRAEELATLGAQAAGAEASSQAAGSHV